MNIIYLKKNIIIYNEIKYIIIFSNAFVYIDIVIYYKFFYIIKDISLIIHDITIYYPNNNK